MKKEPDSKGKHLLNEWIALTSFGVRGYRNKWICRHGMVSGFFLHLFLLLSPSLERSALPCVACFCVCVCVFFFYNLVIILWKFEARFCLFVYFGIFGFVNGGVVLGMVVGGFKVEKGTLSKLRSLVVRGGTDRSSDSLFLRWMTYQFSQPSYITRQF